MNFLKDLFSSKKEEFIKPEVLLEENSPNCPITAIVEQDNRVAYLYLWGPENSSFGTKSCWIRNLKEAPAQKEVNLIQKGIPPMLPKQFCKFPLGQEKLSKENLHLVWLEEGDGVALFEKEELLAIIPSWGGFGDFFGYARDCKGQGDFSWEISDNNILRQRIADSLEFQHEWDTEMNPFQKNQPIILNHYKEIFGKSVNYYAIDGNEWPPKGLYVRNGESKTVFATVGLSLIPQPVVEMYAENRFDVNRIELGLILNAPLTENHIQEMANYISGQADIPWKNITFLGEGHTISCPSLHSEIYTNVILTSNINIYPKVGLDNYRGSQIIFLWMAPISEKERQEVINNGSKELLEKLNYIGEQIFSLDRAEVI